MFVKSSVTKRTLCAIGVASLVYGTILVLLLFIPGLNCCPVIF